ncbi:hypothetical protein COT75_03895 [Candidatus Beckwithbacteria bacterium CG10_big_fil_rev_8_21_14_0_10_34_10]|uniref:Uncharacterized protein n=1 Tax=Candidatus Beckwithbacteria bacterium CG10_big_fil_rev_8_21_14_0_10_34_10 TaxID=1974495 RepID=A0A2H0WAP9_9BACT|nr:MAG: hypothetical protein COT75_03895 [Candidatus Beckwithbacteria bacterium CG10_big_fil_rev_8_21_14_0_10_34_10]
MKNVFSIILKIIKKAFLGMLLIFFLLLILWQIDTKLLRKKPPSAQEVFKFFDFPKDEETCELQGGTWGKIGPHPVKECNLPASDSGKFCTDSNQCQGYCLAQLTQEQLKSGMKGKIIKTNGTCSPTLKVIGCRGFIRNGFASIICLD